MELYAFGDSWTAGTGSDIVRELSFETLDELREFRNTKSWPKFLSDKLGINYYNLSVSGSNNNNIFNSIVSNIKSQKIKKGDFVIVMWSSTLRDTVPFFPENEWHVWGNNYVSNEHKKKWFILNDTTLTKNPNYNEFLIKFKEFYIDELYTQSYYNTINQNYIIFIQKLCEHYGIKYLFCDAFDKMIDNTYPYNDKTDKINKTNYWNFGIKTFKEFLIQTKNNMVWETPEHDILKIPGMHPSELGYRIIAEEIHNYIQSKDILNINTNSISLKFI